MLSLRIPWLFQWFFSVPAVVSQNVAVLVKEQQDVVTVAVFDQRVAVN